MRARLFALLAISVASAACGKAAVEGEAAAPSAPAPEAAAAKAGKGQVLVILSSANKIPLKDGKEYATGYYHYCGSPRLT